MRRFAFSSIRLKLALIYSGVVCLVLIILSLVVYRSVIRNLEVEIDNDLAQRANQARTFFAGKGFTPQDLDSFTRLYGGSNPYTVPTPGNGTIRSGSMSEPDDLASALTYLQLVDSEGHVLQRLPDLKVMAKPQTQQELTQRLKEGYGYSYIKLANGERARVYTVPLERVDKGGYIQVVRSLQEFDAVGNGLVVPFVAASLIAITLLGVFGWWFTKRIFSPIEKITATAYRIGVNNDLTERIETDPKSNDEVSRLGRAFNAMLDRLEKNFKAQKQFIADSAHELRTPLTVIRGNVDLLKRNPDPQNQAESRQAIERESARMQRLVEDLLLLAQTDARQAVELVPLQLDDIVLEVFKETRVLADQRHQHLKMGHFEPVTMEGDRDRLKRAVLNLVDNAIKYTSEEGEITISLIRGKQWARVVVADNGPGIPEKDQSLIFDRFYRVDKARSRSASPSVVGGGSGLGLAIVKHIAEAHGGRISLQSEAGKGSTFTIWLKIDPKATSPFEGDDELEDTGQEEVEKTESAPEKAASGAALDTTAVD